MTLAFIFQYVILSLIIIFTMLIAVSFFTLLERKVLAGIQRRHGPIFTGYFGILQPFADGLKLFFKEVSIPSGGYYYVFLVASMLSLTLSLLSWSVIPFNSKFVVADINFGMLFLLFISSLNVYATLFSGWSSNSKYGLLGSIRAGAQMVSYELPMTLSILPIILYSSSFNLTNIVLFQQYNFWFVFFIPAAYIFFVTALAETNRAPFDLPEAESELVAGYNIEYSSLPFAFFFLAEYNHMLVMSFLFAILFLGGWSNFSTFFISKESFADFYWQICLDFLSNGTMPAAASYYKLLKSFLFDSSLILETSILTFKAILIVLLFITVRAVVPRYKYIQLIKMCWSVFIPVLLFYLTLVVYAYAYAGIGLRAEYLKHAADTQRTIDWYSQPTKVALHEMFYGCDDESLPTNYCNWISIDAFDGCWKDDRFLKYLLVKYNYIESAPHNPLGTLLHDVTVNNKLACEYFNEYYNLSSDFWVIFSQNLAWLNSVFDGYVDANLVREAIEAAESEALERHFGYSKHTVLSINEYRGLALKA